MKNNAFYQAHLALWYHIAYHVTRNKQAACDAVAHTILKLESSALFEGLCPAAQLLAAAMLVRSDAQTQLRDNPSPSPNGCFYTVLDHTEDEPPAPSLLCESDMLLLCIPAQMADILLLCCDSICSVSSVARLLQIDTHTVYSTLDQSKNLLAELLADDDNPDAMIDPVLEAQALRGFVCDAFQRFSRSFPCALVPQLHDTLPATLAPLVLSSAIEQAPASTLPPPATSAPPIAPHAPRLHFERILVTMIDRILGEKTRNGLIFISCCCMLVVSIWDSASWCAGFLRDMSAPTGALMPLFRQTVTVLPAQASAQGYAPRITDLRYSLPVLPAQFRRVEHIQTSSAVITYYSSPAHSLIFSQQVEAEPIQGFQVSAAEELFFGRRKAILATTDGVNRIDWYSGQFYFSLTSDLPAEQLKKIAETAQITSAPYPTPQRIELERLPRPYTPALAHEIGDLVIEQGKAYNRETLDKFLAQCEKKQDCSLRIAYFLSAGTAQLIDLQMQDKQLYCTIDDQLNPQSSQQWERGAAYEKIKLERVDDRQALVLYSSYHAEPYVLLLL